jgi:hypothetical protein
MEIETAELSVRTMIIVDAVLEIMFVSMIRTMTAQ